MAETSAAGTRHVLVVEDTALIADMIAEELQERGYKVVGPVGRLAEALELARSEPLDAALLDVNLAGEMCFPVADLLVQRSVPFAFLTGYSESVLPLEYQTAPRLTKPFEIARLVRLVETWFAKGG